MSNVKYPQVKLQLVGQDGNAFSILGRAKRAVRVAGLDNSIWEEYQKEATSGDYNHLLATTMEFFDCGAEEENEDW